MRSLLSRVSSRSDLNKDESTSTRTEAAPTTPRNPLAPRHPLAKEATLRSSTEAMAQPQRAPASIEQSVRIFRIYEALRNGDTAAISKSIRDSSTAAADVDRQSIVTSVSGQTGALEGTSILHLAVQCADLPVVEYVLSSPQAKEDVNTRDKDGNTPLHVASAMSRAAVVRILLQQKDVNDFVTNYQGKTPLDLAKAPEVFQQLQLARSLYIDSHVQEMQKLVATNDYDKIEELLLDEHFKSAIDVNGGELATDPTVIETGGTLLHEAAKKKDHKLIQVLLLNGADPFRRDRKGKLPQDVTKDDKTKAILKKSPAAAAAQRGIQERTILGSGNPAALTGTATGENALGGKEGREMRGYLKKWVNYTTGYKLRWFVLEDGVLSYYKHQDDAGSACRGAINMKIARLHMDTQDKDRFEILGKSSVKYYLKANHQIEAKRWVWALNNAIQYGKDEAKEATRAQGRTNELLRQAKLAQAHALDTDPANQAGSRLSTLSVSGGMTPLERTPTSRSTSEMLDDEDGAASIDQSISGDDMGRVLNSHGTTAIEGDPDEDEDYADDASEAEAHPVKRDAFLIAAHSARLQLEMLTQISCALQSEKQTNPEVRISDPAVSQALNSHDSALANLSGLLNDLGRIARDREAYWQYRLDQELNVRRIWEDSMLKVAKDQEELENRIGESEEKRKQAKRALREVLDQQNQVYDNEERPTSPSLAVPPAGGRQRSDTRSTSKSIPRRKSTIADLNDIAASDSEENDEEFFDAVDAGEVEVVEELPEVRDLPVASRSVDGSGGVRAVKSIASRSLQSSFIGYEEPIRKRLKMDADNRPKISLWGILKSMIGKDMTKMTLPVSFNEPTSLLQRVAEDMEYTDLLDVAASRSDPTERMLYVAAFAASEYASTIGRVAKPFNPLLGETYEYVRPDKGYRFFIEQVSHHPPVGAAWAESEKWDYYGESAVKSKFYGKSFDINPLGTWFLRLRPSTATSGSSNGTTLQRPAEELYTWRKVTSSVIGIITGSPTVDNYGPMEIKNWTTGETCILEFKARGWKASSAFQVNGRVLDKDGNTRWSVGGRWNDKIYARLTPGYEDADVHAPTSSKSSKDSNLAFLLWEASSRPPLSGPQALPFNLTPFVVTLNALTPSLARHLPPTDTRLRPDQRAMEDGEYDYAAVEKNRLEEKQRATRRMREGKEEIYTPRWFRKDKHAVTGEEYWVALGSMEDSGTRAESDDQGVKYWQRRELGDWEGCEDIF